MNKIIIVLLVALLTISVASAYVFNTVYNPFTGALDYHITGNLTNESLTVTNLTVSGNVLSNLNASGYNITADNFVGNLTGTANRSNYWDNLNTPLDITALGTINSATSITSTAFVGDLTGNADSATTWDGETSQANLNVNSSNYWDNLNTPADINAGDITDDGTYVKVAGDTMSGNLAMGTNNITNITLVNTTNIYVSNLLSNLAGSAYNLTIGKIDTGQGMNELYDMDQNVLTTSAVTFDNVTVSTILDANLNWTKLQNYPAACPAGSYVSTVDDSITCTAAVRTTGDSLSGNLTFDNDTGIEGASAGYVVFNGTHTVIG